MRRLTLDIPDDLRTRMEARAAQSGHQTLEQYVEALIRDDAATDADHGAPEHLKVASREQLEALVLEGLQSPAGEMTAADWDQMKRRLVAKHHQPKAE